MIQLRLLQRTNVQSRSILRPLPTPTQILPHKCTPQCCCTTTTRSYSTPSSGPSKQPSQYRPPTGTHPETFLQTIVLSDGSTCRIRTTSPRPVVTLTKDTRNHPLWNPKMMVVDDTSGEISKFQARFGDSVASLFGSGAVEGNADSKAESSDAGKKDAAAPTTPPADAFMDLMASVSSAGGFTGSKVVKKAKKEPAPAPADAAPAAKGKKKK